MAGWCERLEQLGEVAEEEAQAAVREEQVRCELGRRHPLLLAAFRRRLLPLGRNRNGL